MVTETLPPYLFLPIKQKILLSSLANKISLKHLENKMLVWEISSSNKQTGQSQKSPGGLESLNNPCSEQNFRKKQAHGPKQPGIILPTMTILSTMIYWSEKNGITIRSFPISHVISMWTVKKECSFTFRDQNDNTSLIRLDFSLIPMLMMMMLFFLYVLAYFR